MSAKIITLCYRKIIDTRATGMWDRMLFEDTHKEYCMQVQLYTVPDTPRPFSELLIKNPAAEKLHFLVSAAALGSLKQLNGKIPDIKNNIGKLFLSFTNYQFEIIESSKDISKHIIAVSFFSDPLIWHDTVGDFLLVSPKNDLIEDSIQTDMVKMQPFLSIHTVKNI